MPDPAPKRRWFQFSLRLLLLLVVAANVFWWSHLQIEDARALSTRLAHRAITEAKDAKLLAARRKKEVESAKADVLTASKFALNMTYEKLDGERRIRELQKEVAKLIAEVTDQKTRLAACGCADK